MSVPSAHERFSQLTAEERALLESRLLKPHPKLDHLPAPDTSPKALTHAQESLWFFDQLVPNSPLYIIPQAFLLCGRLDRSALENAFSAMVQRHDALRTRFRAADAVILQAPVPRPWTLPFVDFASRARADREKELEQLLDKEAKRPFDLTQEWLVRACLVRLEEERHVLMISLHHIICDFTSLQVLWEELSAFYNELAEGRSTSSPPPPIPFSSWAARQRQVSEGPSLKSSLEFWKERFSGPLPILELPSDRPRSSVRSFLGGRRVWRMSENLTAALRDCAQSEGVTLYVLLLAGFQALLHRYSGQNEILIGTPVSQRTTPELQRVIGLLLNTVVLGVDLSGNPPFRQVLQQVRKVVLDALSHQEVPLEKVMEALHVIREPGANPLCQVLFQYLPMRWPQPDLKGIACEPLPMETGTAKFDLTLTVLDSGATLSGDLEFSSDLFDPPTVDRLIHSWFVLLNGATSDPTARVGSLPWLTASEREQVLVEWNQTSSHYPREACVHELFQEQARRNPDAPAAVFEGQTVTYGELNRRANRLARFLLRHGVKAREVVCLWSERSLEMLVNLLGILKAGAAYLPLDPKYPAQRLLWMIRDSRASILLKTKEVNDGAAAELPVVVLDPDHSALLSESDADLPNCVGAEDMAYIIYTSGSTGEPKGVAIPHRGVVRLVKGTDYARFESSEVFLQFAPLAFDASTFEIWGALLNGAKLVVYPSEFESLEQFAHVIESNQVSTLWLTAGLFQQVVEQHLDKLGSVRQLLAGGDVLPVPQVKKVLERLPACQLINGYGPTESTTFACCYRFPREWPGSGPAPIGRPISNTQVYLLNQYMAPVPIGVAGELYIGGDGLARGYVSSPELTAQKFLPHPWNLGARLYRTGDRARYLADGNIEFLGRADDQLKLNGFRIHLSEIERALQEMAGVRQAVVVGRAALPDSKQLVAYVVAEERVRGPDLLKLLGEKLPAYMVPSQVVLVGSLPLTRNGKVDRAALLQVAVARPQESPPAALSREEETIAQVWREVFGRQDIGLDDNFFELGGHSLMATRVLSRVNKAFQSNISLGTLLSAPTVRALAMQLSKALAVPALEPIRPRSRR